MQAFERQNSSAHENRSNLDSVDFQWCWPAVPEAHLGSAFEGAKQLLSTAEISEALRTNSSLPSTGYAQQPQVETVQNDAEILEVLPTNLSRPTTGYPQLPLQYPVTSVKGVKKRGLAVIASIETNRPGGEVDRGKLQLLFGFLNFDIDIVVDDSAGIKATLHQLVTSFEHLKDDDCFVYCINAHGGTEDDGRQFVIIGGTEKDPEKLYVVDDILKPISECSYLAKKPKVFIINACRGTGSLVTSTKPEGSSSQVGGKSAGEIQPLYNVSDCLVVFSTSHGKRSHRDVVKGTNFVSALTEAFTEDSGHEDVLSILTSMLGKVTEMESSSQDGYEKDLVQCPQIYSTLTRKLYWSLGS